MGFQTPRYSISKLLDWAGTGTLQLPDFQREFKWDDDRIRELLVTIVRGHPMGVIMVLATGNAQVRFKPKRVSGSVGSAVDPEYLLLDGQQRSTSLFQALTGDGVVETQDARKKRLQRRYYLDIEMSLGDGRRIEEAVLSLPPDGVVRSDFGRVVERDLSSHEQQVSQGIVPFTTLFSDDLTDWLIDYIDGGEPAAAQERKSIVKRFNAEIVKRLNAYEIPAILLDSDTTKEAVATVFEKVNTGGLALDVFELLTATFAGDPAYYAEHGTDFRLADDWARTKDVLQHQPVLTDMQRTDFLQVVTLLTTVRRHDGDIEAGKAKPAATSARREDILRLDLRDYLRWAPPVRDSLPWVAHFLTGEHIHTSGFLPYRTMIVPLAAIRVRLGEAIDTYAVKNRVRQWFWNGVLGELYGSTTETRFARDVEQVPAWARAGIDGSTAEPPDTVKGANFFESRLLSLRTRGSAAYKGIYALLMTQGAKDWRFDQVIDHASYQDLQIDVHHVFPRAWCEKNAIPSDRRESIVNKTPLAKKTNIFIGGRSPADYVPALEKTAGVMADHLDDIITGHAIDPGTLRAGDFDAFFDARLAALLDLVDAAMGKPAIRDLNDDDAVPVFDVEGPEMFETEADDPDPDDEDA